MSNRWPLAALAIAIGATTVLPHSVSAAPAPFEGLPLTCPGIGITILTSPGNGPYTPAFIEGTHDLIVPYVVDVVVTSGSESTRLAGSKAAPIPSTAITCTIDATVHVGGATYALVGSVSGVVVGQP